MYWLDLIRGSAHATARAVAVTLVVAWPLVAVDSAAGATTEIGAVAEIRAGELPAPLSSGGFAVQVADAIGTYAVPAGYTTITAWKHSTGTTAGTLTFKVYRPTGSPQEFLAVASDTRTVTARTVQTFPVQIAVAPGDRIGLSSDDVELAYESGNPADRIGFFGLDIAPGATRATDGTPFEEYKLDVAATLTSSAEQQAPAAGAPYVLPPALPLLRRLTIAPRAFAAARRGPSTRKTKRRGAGARISYRVDVAASVRFAVQRLRPGRRKGRTPARCVAATKRNRRAARCTRYVPVGGAFTQAARAGANGFYFTGRLAGRTLKRGSYRLVATPTAGALTGKSVTTSFRITR